MCLVLVLTTNITVTLLIVIHVHPIIASSPTMAANPHSDISDQLIFRYSDARTFRISSCHRHTARLFFALSAPIDCGAQFTRTQWLSGSGWHASAPDTIPSTTLWLRRPGRFFALFFLSGLMNHTHSHSEGESESGPY